ncbi:MAG: hypothetical protein ACTSSP_08690, partial [Candidatus Asgardarchaeia archaeon]
MTTIGFKLASMASKTASIAYLEKKKIIDENIEKNKIDNHEIILDKSRIKNTYTVSQIPYNHIFKKMLIKT